MEPLFEWGNPSLFFHVPCFLTSGWDRHLLMLDDYGSWSNIKLVVRQKMPEIYYGIYGIYGIYGNDL